MKPRHLFGVTLVFLVGLFIRLQVLNLGLEMHPNSPNKPFVAISAGLFIAINLAIASEKIEGKSHIEWALVILCAGIILNTVEHQLGGVVDYLRVPLGHVNAWLSNGDVLIFSAGLIFFAEKIVQIRVSKER